LYAGTPIFSGLCAKPALARVDAKQLFGDRPAAAATAILATHETAYDFFRFVSYPLNTTIFLNTVISKLAYRQAVYWSAHEIEHVRPEELKQARKTRDGLVATKAVFMYFELSE
jgi:hypothetical protein